VTSNTGLDRTNASVRRQPVAFAFSSEQFAEEFLSASTHEKRGAGWLPLMVMQPNVDIYL
jgi:hypothetical protein